MSNRLKFFLGLFPASLIAIAAEVTIPTLMARLATWTLGESVAPFIAYSLGFLAWLMTVIAIPVSFFYAAAAAWVELGLGGRQSQQPKTIAPMNVRDLRRPG